MADKLRNSSLTLKVLVAVALVAGLLVVAPSAQSQEHSSPVLSASQAQSPPSRCATRHMEDKVIGPITDFFCLEKTASPNPVNVGEPLTFTIRAFCFAEPAFVPCTIGGAAVFDSTVTDTLPPNVQFVSASASGAFAPVTCGESAGTVTCNPETYCKGTLKGIGCPEGTGEIPYVETITVIPAHCGTFTNTVIDSVQQSSLFVGGGPVSATFTVNCPSPTAPPTAAPTCPPPTQGFSERRITSGRASPSTAISNAGNNVNLSPTDQQTANTGSVANEQGVVQSCSQAGDVDLSGSSLTLSPSTTSDSTQTIDQAAAS